MKKQTIMMLALAVLVLGAPAQLIYHTVPQGFDVNDGNYQIPFSTPWGSANPCRWQFTYRWDSLYHQFPVTVFELQFRRSSDANIAGGTYSNVTITMASSTTGHLNPSGTFANNLDTDATVVYSGPVTIPAYTMTGAIPAPWLVTVALTAPFGFDPTRQKDLVIDIQSSGGPANGGGLPLDGTFPSPYVSQNGHVTDANSATANWFNNNAGAIVNLGYIAGSAQHFDISVSTSGGGAGDLTATYSNIPTGTVHGYTLLSLIPASAMGLDYGKGPVFGIWPDVTTFNIAMQPVIQGNPLHWSYPGVPTGFPNVGYFAGAGTFAWASGQTWEVVGVALGAGTNFLGVTAVRQIVW